jgi:osmotically-inducible protein OsmY
MSDDRTDTPGDDMLRRLGERLQESSYLQGRQVILEAHQGRVVLRGTVQSYFQKQMAQELVRRFDGVQSVENRLVVHWAAATAAEPPTTAVRTATDPSNGGSLGA